MVTAFHDAINNHDYWARLNLRAGAGLQTRVATRAVVAGERRCELAYERISLAFSTSWWHA